MEAFEHRAQYYETDQMGVVHHSNYIRWFESARIDYMEQMGIPYGKMEEQGIISPVLTVSCEYRSMTHFGDIVLIEAKIKEYNSVRLVLSYEVREKKSGVLKASGETSHCFLNKEGKIISLKKEAPETDAVFRRFAAVQGKDGQDGLSKKD